MVQSLSDLIKYFITWAEKSLAPGSVANYRRHLERFLAAVGDLPANQVRAHHLLAWGSTWHQIQAVQRLFSFAVNDAELLDRNHVRRVKRPPLGQRRRILDRPTEARLLRRSSPDFRSFLLAMRETLCRPQEIRDLWWEFVYWEERPAGLRAALESGRALFVFDEFKGRKRRREATDQRVIPISPRLGRLLWRLSKEGTETHGPAFRARNGRPWTNNAIRLRMQWVRNKLGLRPDHRGENVVCYTIRHTQATAAAAAGVRDRVLADLMGHTTPRTTARYQHLQVEHLVEAMKTIRARRRRKAG